MTWMRHTCVLCVCGCQSECVSDCLCLSVYLSVCLYDCLSVCLCVCVSVCLCVCVSEWSPVRLSVYLLVCLLAYTSVCACLSAPVRARVYVFACRRLEKHDWLCFGLAPWGMLLGPDPLGCWAPHRPSQSRPGPFSPPMKWW